MVILFVLSSATSYFNNFLQGKLQFLLYKEVSQSAFNVLQMSSIKNSTTKTRGDLLTRILGNTQLITNIITKIFPQFIMACVSLIFPFFILLSLNAYLTMITISPVLFFIVISVFMGRKMETIQKKILEINALLFQVLNEFIAIIPLIKIFNLEKWSNKNFKEQMGDYCSSSIKYTKISSISYFFNAFFMSFPIILFFWQGSLMVMDGSISIGTFTAFITYITMFFSPISQLSTFYTTYKSTLPAFDRIKEVFDMLPEKDGNHDLMFNEGEIIFENVFFSYDDKAIIKSFNATFKRGLNYIVGDNGSGKSTIIKLILRLYHPDKGTIKIDGQDISQLNKKSLINHISTVFSTPYLFSGTIYDNIKVGDLKASENDIIHALDLAELTNFINEKPEQYKFNVSEDGNLLSSGQKQKMALARAILKNAPILLLDEATKSVDTHSRESINKIVTKFKNEKTIIIVTHNLEEVEPNSNIIHL
ncbi:MAG: ABC transporter ATP-binding protein/permease [Methanobrevibacter sp.]|jgi:ATP-binding cassette subfamily B protein/subfamily B ATP-binding cassette protein MsbA|nr:ABC transporter ATP-binding protein/permease [Methanobrevibacter sp.]